MLKRKYNACVSGSLVVLAFIDNGDSVFIHQEIFLPSVPASGPRGNTLY